jgi:hypothetical protein
MHPKTNGFCACLVTVVSPGSFTSRIGNYLRAFAFLRELKWRYQARLASSWGTVIFPLFFASMLHCFYSAYLPPRAVISKATFSSLRAAWVPSVPLNSICSNKKNSYSIYFTKRCRIVFAISSVFKCTPFRSDRSGQTDVALVPIRSALLRSSLFF